MATWHIVFPTRDNAYTLTCFSTYMTCSCPSFLYQHGRNGQRICKHLNQWREQVKQLSNPFHGRSEPSTPPRAPVKPIGVQKSSKQTPYGTCAVFQELRTAEQWQRMVDEHWWYSEKKDGIRVKWCAQTQCLRSSRTESAHCWTLPEAWKKTLGSFSKEWDLDLEFCGSVYTEEARAREAGLWDHKQNVIVSSLRQALTLQGDITALHPWWKHAHLYILDYIPRDASQDIPWERRYRLLQKHIEPSLSKTPWITLLPQYPIGDTDVLLRRFYADVIAAGGEGVMIRDPTSTYYVSSYRRGLKWKQWITREVKGVVRDGHVYFEGWGKRHLPVRPAPYRIELENVDSQGQPRSIRWAVDRWTPPPLIFSVDQIEE
jgi:ATP dependent DNA ligase domain